jgi:hypothetical protein
MLCAIYSIAVFRLAKIINPLQCSVYVISKYEKVDAEIAAHEIAAHRALLLFSSGKIECF